MLLRKLAIILISVFVRAGAQTEFFQSYAAIIVLLFALCLPLSMHPYESLILHRLETMALSTLIGT